MKFSTIKPYFHLLTAWWRSEEKKFAWGGIVVISTFIVFDVYLAVLMNEWEKGFFDAIENKDIDSFYYYCLIFVPLVTFVISCNTGDNYFYSWYSFRWRQWVTKNLENDWLSYKNYYLLPHKSDNIDNPDQRISVDSMQITTSTVSLISGNVRSILNSIRSAA